MSNPTALLVSQIIYTSDHIGTVISKGYIPVYKNVVDFSSIINFANNYEDIGHLNSIQKF